MKVPKEELEQRLKKVQECLQMQGIEVVLLTHKVDIGYLSGVSYFDLLCVGTDNPPVSIIIGKRCVDHLDSSAWDVVFIESVASLNSIVTDYLGREPQVLGLQLDVLPVEDFLRLKNFFPYTKIVNGSGPILTPRMTKSRWELKQLQKTAALSAEVFDHLKNIIKPELNEMEFATKAEAFFQKLSGSPICLRVRNHLTEGYPWHVLSGPSGGAVGLLDSPASGIGTSPAFPCGAGYRVLSEKMPIMVDFACEFNSYHMDETRMFSIGPLPTHIKEACHVAIEIHDSVLEMVKPGVTAGELYEHAVQKADSLGYGSTFLGPDGYKVRFIGHGIGLELIEPPILAEGKEDKLLPGMTFALEPKLVAKDEFIAGIESVFVVTESGHEVISKVPVKIFDS